MTARGGLTIRLFHINNVISFFLLAGFLSSPGLVQGQFFTQPQSNMGFQYANSYPRIIPPSPCPANFQYQLNGREYYATVTLNPGDYVHDFKMELIVNLLVESATLVSLPNPIKIPFFKTDLTPLNCTAQ